MDIEENWGRIKTHRARLKDHDIQGLAEVLFLDREDWLAEKLRLRDDTALAIELLGCLGHAGSVKAAEILLEQLETREEVLQVATAEALKRCPPVIVLTSLTKMMSEQNQGAVKAGEILLSFGQEGIQELWRLWFGEHKPARLRYQILQLLTEAGDERAERLAFLAFLSEDDELAGIALKAAEELDARSLWGNVTECLKSSDWRIRGRAARVLGLWGEKKALAFLSAMGSDEDPWVEEEKQKALALLSESEI